MRYPRHDFERQSKDSRSAIFVDYENLYSVIHDRFDQRSYPDEYISEMIDELRRYLLEEERSQPSLSVALADFSTLAGNGFFIQRSLYLQGVDPRFIPASLQSNAVELQLCADVAEALHTRPDIRTFAILTGDRAYLPLVQQLKRYGRTVLLASLDAVNEAENIQYAEGDYHLDAHRLLSDASRRELLSAAPEGVRRAAAESDRAVVHREPVEYKEVTDPVQLRTLDIVETFFGQYEEVYLTPLLRKLSELLDDREHDPKTIISSLEELGAVRLEKRRGFPYDYTVLIIDGEHPDVKRVQQEVLARDVDADEAYDEEYDDEYDDEFDDEYSEDYFDEDDYSDEEPLNETRIDEEPR